MVRRRYRRLRSYTGGTREIKRSDDFLWAEDEAAYRLQTGKQFHKIPDSESGGNKWFKLLEGATKKLRLEKHVLTVFVGGGQHAVMMSAKPDRSIPFRSRKRSGTTFCGMEFESKEDSVGSSPINELVCLVCRDEVIKIRRA
jgi:hypothetical protein